MNTIGKHLATLMAVVVACMCAEQPDQTARQTRTPGLLHLAHAGHPVGSYVLAGPRQASSGGGGGGSGGGGGGPHIVIVGDPGAAHVTTHHAGRESLEEIDDEIRQHYGRPVAPQGVRYVPNSSQRGVYQEARTLPGYAGHVGALGHTPGQVALPLRYGLYQPQPGHGFTQSTTFVGHSFPQTHHTAVAHTLPQAHLAAAYRPTPTPLTHYPSTATPLASPSPSPARLPLQHGLRYQPVFIPLHAAATPYNHQFGLSQSHPQYSNYVAGAASGRSPAYSGEQSEDKPQYYQDSQERRSEYPKYPSNYPRVQERRPDYPGQERGYYSSGERSPQAYSDYDKSYKFGSDESGAKAATTAYQTYQDDEDTSGEVSSAERPGSYKFFDGHSGGSGRGYGGGGKGVATSYQSVTLETGHSAPIHSHPHQAQP